VLLAPGQQVAFHADLPTVLCELPQARGELALLPLGAAGVVDLETLETAPSGGVRDLVLMNPHNPTGP
jgi:histidinol-phosphate/aromatic aminotransferase/cobyric acid decarboxylase-like protein